MKLLPFLFLATLAIAPLAFGALLTGCSNKGGTACVAPKIGSPSLSVWPDDATVLHPGPAPDATGFTPAPHAAFPTMPRDELALTPTNIRFEVITEENDPLFDRLMAFAVDLGTSKWWKDVGADYDLPPTVTSVSAVQGNPFGGDIRDADLETYIHGTSQYPDPDSADSLTIRVVFLAPKVNVITSEGANCGCSMFGGYHAVSRFGQVYAVVQRCPTAGDAELDGLTTIASHEIIEAATNLGPTARVHFRRDPAAVWKTSALAATLLDHETEVGDVCGVRIYEGPWAIERIWSNAHAAAGKPPCIPYATSEPYFNVTAPQDWYPLANGTHSVSIPLSAWSEAPRADWYVSVDAKVGAAKDAFTAALDGGGIETIGTHAFHAVNNGGTATLTVTRTTHDATTNPYVVVRIRSRSVAPGLSHSWNVGVYVP